MSRFIPQVVYTNSNCSDIWNIFVSQYNEHTNSELFVISDSYDFPIEDKNKVYVYSNNDEYYKVWVNALKKFDLKNFIYLQEDFLLYDKANDEKIIELSEILNKSKYSFIRLIKSGNLNSVLHENNIYEIESCNSDIFSMQATIWKTKDYIHIMENVKEPKWLETYNYKNFMCNNNISGLYYYNGEPKRGLNHYDSTIYPYIATAIVKGKWNISEYKSELNLMIEKYGININKRNKY